LFYEYRSDSRKWEALLKNESYYMQNLYMSDLPIAVLFEKWDVIIIDAPYGWPQQGHPGRMLPIYTTSIMVGNSLKYGKKVHIFVHDMDRPIETQYSAKFFPGSHIWTKVKLAYFLLN